MPAPQRRMRVTPRPTVEVQSTRTTTVRRGTRNTVHDEAEERETLAQDRFEAGEEPAFVRFGAGLTINLQNYESLRLDVSVTLPCRTTELDQTMDTAVAFVAEKLTDEKEKWMGGQ